MATRRGPDNTVRWSVGGLISGVAWRNIYWALLTPNPTITQSDFDGWLNVAATAHKTNFQGLMSVDVTYVSATATLFLPGNGSMQSTFAMSGAGTGGAALPDTEACHVLSWKSSVYWRGGKPRSYLPGVATANINADHRTLTSTIIGTLTTNAGSLRTTVNADTKPTITGSVFGFVSFRSGNADRIPPVFFPITGAVVHPRLGSQRRHLGKWTP